MPDLAARRERCVIIGSGPAGYTAAIYAGRALLKPLLIAGAQPGGQLTGTTDVENYPGFAKVIQGPWLMAEMDSQAKLVGAIVLPDVVVTADLSQRPFRLELGSGSEIIAETLIIATGAHAQWLGLPSERRFQGFGVSACATCDGYFYRGQQVIVVGGGNTAVEEALFLATLGSEVKLVHRRDELRADKILQERLFATSRVRVIWDSAVEEILGTHDPIGVVGARVRNCRTGKVQDLEAHAIFVAIGHRPASNIFLGQLETDAQGYIRVKPGRTSTAVRGVFAAGDVTDDVFRQAVTAAGMGCMAALEAVRLLAKENREPASTAAQRF